MIGIINTASTRDIMANPIKQPDNSHFIFEGCAEIKARAVVDNAADTKLSLKKKAVSGMPGVSIKANNGNAQGIQLHRIANTIELISNKTKLPNTRLLYAKSPAFGKNIYTNARASTTALLV